MEIHGATIHSKIAKEIERLLIVKRFHNPKATDVADQVFDALRKFEVETGPIEFMCYDKKDDTIALEPSNLYTFVVLSGFEQPDIFDLPKYGIYEGKIAKYRYEIEKDGELKKQIIFSAPVKYIEVQITLHNDGN